MKFGIGLGTVRAQVLIGRQLQMQSNHREIRSSIPQVRILPGGEKKQKLF